MGAVRWNTALWWETVRIKTGNIVSLLRLILRLLTGRLIININPVRPPGNDYSPLQQTVEYAIRRECWSLYFLIVSSLQYYYAPEPLYMLTMGVYKHRNRFRNINQFSLLFPTQFFILDEKKIWYLRFDATLIQYGTLNQKVRYHL